MKIIKIALVAAVFGVLAIAVWNKITLQKFVKGYEHQKAEVNRLLNVNRQMQKAVVNSLHASMKHIGRDFLMGDMEKVFPENDKPRMHGQARLVIVFSELGCNVCMDSETTFAVSIAKKFGGDAVLAIVYSNEKRYVRRYIRVNRVNFPVYYCKDEALFHDNHITNTPMLFVIDESGRIVAAHFPIPGHPVYSEPFHRFCASYIKSAKN